jgi:hypothetical protein
LPLHGLPCGTRDQGERVGQTVFQVEGYLVLVEISIIGTLAITIEGRFSPVDKGCGDDEAVTARLRPRAR